MPTISLNKFIHSTFTTHDSDDSWKCKTERQQYAHKISWTEQQKLQVSKRLWQNAFYVGPCEQDANTIVCVRAAETLHYIPLIRYGVPMPITFSMSLKPNVVVFASFFFFFFLGGDRRAVPSSLWAAVDCTWNVIDIQNLAGRRRIITQLTMTDSFSSRWKLRREVWITVWTNETTNVNGWISLQPFFEVENKFNLIIFFSVHYIGYTFDYWLLLSQSQLSTLSLQS